MEQQEKDLNLTEEEKRNLEKIKEFTKLIDITYPIELENLYQGTIRYKPSPEDEECFVLNGELVNAKQFLKSRLEKQLLLDFSYGENYLIINSTFSVRNEYWKTKVLYNDEYVCEFYWPNNIKNTLFFVEYKELVMQAIENNKKTGEIELENGKKAYFAVYKD